MLLLGFVSSKIYVRSRFEKKFKCLQQFQMEVVMRCDHPTIYQIIALSAMWVRHFAVV
jgi:hypothetical protein